MAAAPHNHFKNKKHLTSFKISAIIIIEMKKEYGYE